MATELVVQSGGVVASYMPALTAKDVNQRYHALVEFVKTQLQPGRDYGEIPGTKKDTLLKPGAEKLCTFFGLRVDDPEIIEKVEDWTGADHGGEPFFYYMIRQRLSRNGEVVASQIGSCNSWEKKYRWRDESKKCPQCGNPTIIKGKKEFGGGWLCWKNKGGCGAKFRDGDKAVEAQQTGRVPNPDVFDQVNTIQKMALKRALIAAVLVAVNASDFFTQDIDDLELPPHHEDGEVIEAPPQPARQRQQPAAAPKNGDHSAGGVALVSTTQAEEIVNEIKASGLTWGDFKGHWKVSKVTDIPSDRYFDVMAWLKNAKSQKNAPRLVSAAQIEHLRGYIEELCLSPEAVAKDLAPFEAKKLEDLYESQAVQLLAKYKSDSEQMSAQP